MADPTPTETKSSAPAGGRALKLLLVNPTIVFKREHLHLGLGTVGTYVKLHSRHDVRVLDFMVFRKVWKQKLRDTIAEYRPDVIGFYISSPYFPAAREIAEEIKRIAPDVPVLAGGHHATLAPDETIAAQAFDMLIVGEGEKPIVKLLDTIAAGEPLENVRGLWFRENGAVRKIPKDTLLEPENLPGIDWSIFDEETLRANFYYWGILPVMGSRGCPAHCSFCSITNVQELYKGERFLRFRDPIEVVDEIEGHWERYKDWGLRTIFFYDLNFLVNVPWLQRFCAEYKRRGLNRKLKWSAYTRADHVSPAAIEALRDSGCINLRVGIEAANPYMRNVLYEKDVDQQELLAALHRIKSIGATIIGYFMAGGPGERPEWLVESLELAKRSGVEFPVFFLYKPLAGTSILERAEELGSHVLDGEMEKGADFLHGVQMSHAHIKSWQLQAYMLTTHLLFGPQLVLWQMRRAGLRYPVQLATYLRRAVRDGFTPYGALTYFIFYAYDHLEDPLVVPERPDPGPLWKAAMAFTRAWMGHSGEPQPPLPPRRKGGTHTTVEHDAAHAPAPPPIVPAARLRRPGAVIAE